MANKNRRNFKNEINPGSMADIGFLLLIFFLVSTTIKVDEGITVKLPPYKEDVKPPIVNKRNICRILVNQDDQLLVRGQEMNLESLTEYVKNFITNPNSNPDFALNPTKAIISLQNDRATSYSRYIEVYNEIKKAYNQLRNEQAKIQFGISFADCKDFQKEQIIKQIPLLLSESEPADYSDK